MSPIVAAAVKDAFSGLPVWTRIVGVVGFPVAVAAFVLWVLFGGKQGVAAKISEIRDSQITHTQQSNAHHQEFHEAQQAHEANEKVMRAILAQICANGAKSTSDRGKCFPEAEGK